MTAMTNAELSAAIRRAHTEYEQEVAAATDEYDGVRQRPQPAARTATPQPAPNETR